LATGSPSGYLDRRDAGRQLAAALSAYAGQPNVVVLGLPRGGVPVADEVASALHAPLDVFIVRKLGAPWHSELALGALAEGGIEIRHRDAMASFGVSDEDLDHVARREREELARRVARYRGHRPPQDLRNRVVILVDDGLATGSTMEAAIAAVRRHEPARLIVAVPVGAVDTCRRLIGLVDDLVCPLAPAQFSAVGEWYADFSQTTDEEVAAILAAAKSSSPLPKNASDA
jgi:predicted phosphoribosyltransferase